MTGEDAARALSGVGSTAVGVAVALAAESARADRLFHDPLAGEFVRAAGSAQSVWSSPDSELLRRAMGDYLALRTRFFDDHLIRAAGEGCTQVVAVAAGLDTRAFRLPWPAGTHLYEVDRADVFQFKEAVIAETGARPGCERSVITADLREDWTAALRDAGFDGNRRTAWLVEGLIVYLTAQEANELAAGIGRMSAPGSRLGLEHVKPPTLIASQAGAELAQGRDTGVTLLSTLWRNEETAPPDAWIAGHGWSPRTQDLATLAAAHGRPVPIAFDARLPGTARAVLIEAERATGPR